MKLLLDKQPYTYKPTTETGKINDRILNCMVDITPEQLANEVAKGKTFIPAYIGTKVNGKLERNKNNWTSQELMCIDFDNEMTVPNPDYPHNSNKKKLKVKNITLTLEEAIEVFKDTAAFIYTTFNHTSDHPKFRVVFIFEEVVTDTSIIDATLEYYKNLYPDSDQSCFERARLFYGGKDIYVLNFDNRIPVIKSEKCNLGFCDYDSSKVYTNAILVTKTPYTHQPSNNRYNNIDLIKQKDKDALRQRLQHKPIKFYTYAEHIEYIKRLDISELLGVSNNCNCPFHDDTSPSARIFYNEQTKDSLFHCNSSNCDFNTGTIIKVIERLTKLNRNQAIKYIREIYNIQFEQTEFQREQLELIDENIRYLQSGYMELEYPEQYKIMKRYTNDLIQFLTFSKDYIPPEHYSPEQSKVLFFTSLGHFAKFLGRTDSDQKRIGDKLALFAYFSYIHKLKETEIPEYILNRAKFEVLKSKKHKNDVRSLIGVYEIPSYSEDVLSFAEEKAKKYHNNHMTMRGLSYELLLRTFGEEEALRVYPQMEGRKIKSTSNFLTHEMELTVMDLLNQKGWVTEREVVNLVAVHFPDFTKTKLERQIKVIIGELVQKYELRRIRTTSKILNELGIGVIISENGNPSFPYILKK